MACNTMNGAKTCELLNDAYVTMGQYYDFATIRDNGCEVTLYKKDFDISKVHEFEELTNMDLIKVSTAIQFIILEFRELS